MDTGCLEALVHDVCALLRVTDYRGPAPSALVADGRTFERTPESGARAGYGGAERRQDSKVLFAVDTLGHLLSLRVSAADEQERAQVGALVDVRAVTGETVSLVCVDDGYKGEAAAASAGHGIAQRW